MTFHTVEAHNGEITEGKPKIDRDYCNDHECITRLCVTVLNNGGISSITYNSTNMIINLIINLKKKWCNK